MTPLPAPLAYDPFSLLAVLLAVPTLAGVYLLAGAAGLRVLRDALRWVLNLEDL